MQYFINKKNIKQSIQNLSSFLKDKGYEIPRNIILEAFSKSLFFKNWNTLEGLSTKPDLINHIPEKKSYMIEVECSLSKDLFLKALNDSFSQGKCHVNVDNFIYEEKKFHVEISFPHKNDNFLTAMFILASSLKSYQVTRFDLLRIVFEKENLLPAVELDLQVKIKI